MEKNKVTCYLIIFCFLPHRSDLLVHKRRRKKKLIHRTRLLHTHHNQTTHTYITKRNRRYQNPCQSKMHPHILIQLLTGFTLSALVSNKGWQKPRRLFLSQDAGRSLFLWQTASRPTLSSINPARTASTTLPLLQPADKKPRGEIQEVAGGNDTAMLLSNRSVPNPVRHPMCKRYLNVSLSPPIPLPSATHLWFINLVWWGGEERVQLKY